MLRNKYCNTLLLCFTLMIFISIKTQAKTNQITNKLGEGILIQMYEDKLLPSKSIFNSKKIEEHISKKSNIESTVLENINLDTDVNFLMNNNIYRNNYFKFNITLNDYWDKPSYSEAKFFADGKDAVALYTVSDDSELMILIGNKQALAQEGYNYSSVDDFVKITRDETILASKSTANEDGKITKVSEIKSSKLNNVDFKYYYFDLSSQGYTLRFYTYVTMKNDNFYIFLPVMATDSNASEISKVLKTAILF